MSTVPKDFKRNLKEIFFSMRIIEIATKEKQKMEIYSPDWSKLLVEDRPFLAITTAVPQFSNVIECMKMREQINKCW